MNFSMRPAEPCDVAIVSAVLTEAALWLEQTGKALWRAEDMTVEKVLPDIGRYFIAEVNGEVAGILKLQLKDRIFWPDFAEDDSAYIHRVTVRRSFAGRGISRSMLLWAADHARSLGKKYLRLDCEAGRPRPGLRAVYENFGFGHHSDRKVGPYQVARYQYTI